MDFSLPEEVQFLQRQTREFVQGELQPFAEEIEQRGEVPEEVRRKLREKGYFGMLIPKEWGGLGMSYLEWLVVVVELGKTHGLINHLLDPQGQTCLLFDGTQEQKEKWLPPFAHGEITAAFALTEPGAGSDAQGISTSAVKQNGDWVINGMKHFIGLAELASVITVVAVTDKEKKARGGITLFLVEKKNPGMKLGRRQTMMGPLSPYELYLDDCVVPGSDVIGEVGWGFRTVGKNLDAARLDLGAQALGISERCLEDSIRYARQRVTFGQPIAERQGVQWMITEMAVGIHALRLMFYDAASRLDQGLRISHESAIVKLFGSELACNACDMAIQIHGGMGYCRDLPYEGMYRNARMFRIIGGASEIMKWVIARGLLRE